MEIFKAKYPEKVRNEAFEIPEKVDIHKLIEKIEASPWLQKNFYLEIMCQKYDDIIADKYAPFEKVPKAQETPSKNKGRNFTKEELDGLFDDMENIEL